MRRAPTGLGFLGAFDLCRRNGRFAPCGSPGAVSVLPPCPPVTAPTPLPPAPPAPAPAPAAARAPVVTRARAPGGRRAQAAPPIVEGAPGWTVGLARIAPPPRVPALTLGEFLAMDRPGQEAALIRLLDETLGAGSASVVSPPVETGEAQRYFRIVPTDPGMAYYVPPQYSAPLTYDRTMFAQVKGAVDAARDFGSHPPPISSPIRVDGLPRLTVPMVAAGLQSSPYVQEGQGFPPTSRRRTRTWTDPTSGIVFQEQRRSPQVVAQRITHGYYTHNFPVIYGVKVRGDGRSDGATFTDLRLAVAYANEV